MIDKLEFLLAVARERNFRRTAETCGVAQPTLSAGIKSLGAELGVLLIHRSSRFQEFTPEGERVLEWARSLVSGARSLRQEVRSFRTGLTGELRLAVIPTALSYTPAITRPFRARHPGVRFSILSLSSDAILQQIDGLQVDAGVTYLGNETLGRLQAFALYQERYCLVTSAGSPLCKQTSVTWAAVGQLPLCLFPRHLQNRRIIDRLLRGAGGDAGPCVVEADSTVALLSHVRAGGLSTILSEQVATLLAAAAPFCILPIEGGAMFTVGMVLPEREPLPPLLRALLDVVKQVTDP